MGRPSLKMAVQGILCLHTVKPLDHIKRTRLVIGSIPGTGNILENYIVFGYVLCCMRQINNDCMIAPVYLTHLQDIFGGLRIRGHPNIVQPEIFKAKMNF
jgi:hypothetical protein